MKAKRSRNSTGFSLSGSGYTSTFFPVAICPTLIFCSRLMELRAIILTFMYLFFSVITVLIIYIIFCYLVARKRRIGFWWALFFCITLFIIGGVILTLISPQVTAGRKFKENGENKEMGFMLGLIAGLLFLVSLNVNNSWDNILFFISNRSVFYNLLAPVPMKMLYFGLCGLGIFIYESEEGKSWNNAVYAKTERAYEEDMKQAIQKAKAWQKNQVQKLLKLSRDRNQSPAEGQPLKEKMNKSRYNTFMRNFLLFKKPITKQQVIAREFLLLVLSITVAIFIFLIALTVASFSNYRSNHLLSEIDFQKNVSDSLQKGYLDKYEKQSYFFTGMIDAGEINENETDLNNVNKLWGWMRYVILNSDDHQLSAIFNKDFFYKDNKFYFYPYYISSINMLKTFIYENSFTTEDSANFSKGDSIMKNVLPPLEKSQIDWQERKISFKNCVGYGIIGMGACIFLLFIVRYFFYSIRWSIRTLKS